MERVWRGRSIRPLPFLTPRKYRLLHRRSSASRASLQIIFSQSGENVHSFFRARKNGTLFAFMAGAQAPGFRRSGRWKPCHARTADRAVFGLRAPARVLLPFHFMTLRGPGSEARQRLPAFSVRQTTGFGSRNYGFRFAKLREEVRQTTVFGSSNYGRREHWSQRRRSVWPMKGRQPSQAKQARIGSRGEVACLAYPSAY